MSTSDLRCTQFVPNDHGRCKFKKIFHNGILQPFCKRHFNLQPQVTEQPPPPPPPPVPQISEVIWRDLFENVSLLLSEDFGFEDSMIESIDVVMSSSPQESTLQFEQVKDSKDFYCPVCMENLSSVSSIKLPCIHVFCGLCIIKVSNRICPLCRDHF